MEGQVEELDSYPDSSETYHIKCVNIHLLPQVEHLVEISYVCICILYEEQLVHLTASISIGGVKELVERIRHEQRDSVDLRRRFQKLRRLYTFRDERRVELPLASDGSCRRQSLGRVRSLRKGDAHANHLTLNRDAGVQPESHLDERSPPLAQLRQQPSLGRLGHSLDEEVVVVQCHGNLDDAQKRPVGLVVERVQGFRLAVHVRDGGVELHVDVVFVVLVQLVERPGYQECIAYVLVRRASVGVTNRVHDDRHLGRKRVESVRHKSQKSRDEALQMPWTHTARAPCS